MKRMRPAWGRTALIGSTGFVGGALSRDATFDAAYASATIDQIAGQAFDTVICAGAPGAMWRANSDPDGDKANLETLVAALMKAEIGRLVLISTIAVLADPAAGSDETTTGFETDIADGRNRRWLEEALSDRFATLTLRLPAVFGHGLKKNFLFDLRHPMPAFLKPEAYAALRGRLDRKAIEALDQVYSPDAKLQLVALDRTALSRHPERDLLTEGTIAARYDATGFTHADSTFQFYDLGNLADDIETALQLGLNTLHLAVEPWRASDLSELLTGQALETRTAPLRTEDLRTGHAPSFGGTGPHIRSRDQVLEAIRRDWDAGAW